MFDNPICVALDTPDAGKAALLARSLRGAVGLVKVGKACRYSST
jgi:orotidine-5'-phosphate decarboxylase